MSDYSVTPSAIIEAARFLEEKGTKIVEVTHTAFSIIENLGIERHWVGTQYNKVADKLNSFDEQYNAMLKNVAYQIPLSLNDAAQEYARANDYFISPIVVNMPQLLDPITVFMGNMDDNIIFHQTDIENAVQEFTSTLENLKNLLTDYKDSYAVNTKEWIGEASQNYTIFLTEYVNIVIDLAAELNKTISEQAQAAVAALAAAEKTNASNASNVSNVSIN